jgi:hypothetical protein
MNIAQRLERVFEVVGSVALIATLITALVLAVGVAYVNIGHSSLKLVAVIAAYTILRHLLKSPIRLSHLGT